MSEGYLYILFNAGLRENHWKIGRTTRTPEERARKLSEPTGVVWPFEVAYKVRVADCERAEALVHRELKEYRVPNREFFVVDLDQAVRILTRAADSVGHAAEAAERERIPVVTEPAATDSLELDFVTGASVGRRRVSRGKEMPIEEHLRKLSRDARDAFYALHKRILSFNPTIEMLSCQPYVRYRLTRNFAEITFLDGAQAMKVWIKEMDYDDPLHLVETGSHDWRLKSFVWLTSEDQVDYVASLVKASMRMAG